MNSENDLSNNLTPKHCYVRSKNIDKISPLTALKGAKTLELPGAPALDPARARGFALGPQQGP